MIQGVGFLLYLAGSSARIGNEACYAQVAARCDLSFVSIYVLREAEAGENSLPLSKEGDCSLEHV
jgi:hypothetical protein